jgi:hypothetical protein
MIYLTTAQIKANARAVMAMGYLQGAAKNPGIDGENIRPDGCRCVIGASIPPKLLEGYEGASCGILIKNEVIELEDIEAAVKLQNNHDRMCMGIHSLPQSERIAILTDLLKD